MLPIDPVDIIKWLAGVAVTAFGVLLTRNINRVESDIEKKADSAHMVREIQRLESQLQESRDARERDIERIERASSEKFSEFSEAMRDRLNSLERNIDQRLTLILQAVSSERRT